MSDMCVLGLHGEVRENDRGDEGEVPIAFRESRACKTAVRSIEGKNPMA